MLVQERLIARTREVCEADEALVSALTYGSFASGEGDAYSDVEFWLFFAPERVPADKTAWCERIAPVRHMVVNEFGTHVAFFPGPVRGEFHFVTARDVDQVGGWPYRSAPVTRWSSRTGTAG